MLLQSINCLQKWFQCKYAFVKQDFIVVAAMLSFPARTDMFSRYLSVYFLFP